MTTAGKAQGGIGAAMPGVPALVGAAASAGTVGAAAIAAAAMAEATDPVAVIDRAAATAAAVTVAVIGPAMAAAVAMAAEVTVVAAIAAEDMAAAVASTDDADLVRARCCEAILPRPPGNPGGQLASQLHAREARFVARRWDDPFAMRGYLSTFRTLAQIGERQKSH
jgi:hypothetical protein